MEDLNKEEYDMLLNLVREAYLHYNDFDPYWNNFAKPKKYCWGEYFDLCTYEEECLAPTLQRKGYLNLIYFNDKRVKYKVILIPREMLEQELLVESIIT